MWLAGSSERHRRRNVKRKRLGLPMTEPYDSISSNSESDVDQVLETSSPTGSPKKQTVSRGKPSLTKVTPSPACIGAIMDVSQASIQSTKIAPGGSTGYRGTARPPTERSQLKPVSLPTKKISVLPQASSRNLGIMKSTSKIGRTAAVPGAQEVQASIIKTARRTQPAPRRLLGNVFVDGKVRKTRKAKDREGEPPKLYRNASQIRAAELRARALPDRAPEASSIPSKLFPISQGPIRLPILETRAANQTVQGPQATDELPKESSVQLEERPAEKKRRKSVRFLEDFDESDSPSAGDEDMFAETRQVEAHNTTQKHFKLKAARKKLSLSEHQPQPRLPATQGIVKQIILGPPGSHPIPITFTGVPRTTQQEWHVSFMSQSCLNCPYVFFGKSLLVQWNGLTTHCRGTILAKGDESAIEWVARYLRATASGLYYSHTAFNLIIYPTGCDGWQSSLPEFADISAKEELNYVLFGSLSPLTPFLRGPSIGGQAQTHGRSNLMEKFFDLNAEQYRQLLPDQIADFYTAPCFYLAFPSSSTDISQQLTSWLRAHDQTCEIFAGQIQGSWCAFLERIKSGQHAGIVIIDEAATPAIRRFPGILNLLMGKVSCSFWYYYQNAYTQSLFPWNAVTDSPRIPSPPGQAGFLPLLHRGVAILVTPSFLVSQPRRTFELLEWYGRNKKVLGNFRFITAWGIRSYLQQLAEQKLTYRQGLLKQLSDENDMAIAAAERGLDEEDCQFRFKVWLAVSELFASREDMDSFSAIEEKNPLIYAPSDIDANDEQSLVNWFGAWSIGRLNNYRHFLVIGSSRGIHGSERARRVMTIPTYTTNTVRAPDTAFHAVPTVSAFPTVGNGDRTEHPEGRLMAASSHTPDQPSRPIPPSKYTPPTITNLTSQLMNLASTRQERVRWKLYGYPVLWRDSAESCRFHELDPKKSTFDSWWSYLWAWQPNNPFRTYFGLFWTVIDGESEGSRPARNAWIASYRPVDPHLYWKPLRQVELIIWDLSAAQKFKGQTSIGEDMLPSAQRDLIRLVRERTGIKNPDSFLSDVWLGGFSPALPGQKDQHDVEAALATLLSLAQDTNAVLPPPQSRMEAHGYLKVVEAKGNIPSPEKRVDACDDTLADGDLRIVFHPPRATFPLQGPSKCQNHLFESARLARLDPTKTTMEFNFRPTLEWYDEQRAEGRGFEHINVNTPEEIFKLLHINSAA
jgi:chromo domain-containing protein 1